MKKYDAIVIGFGKAGKTLAAELSLRGEKVALIEKDPSMYGGTCINVGCIPSKRLVTDAENSPRDKSLKKDYYKDAILEKRKLTSALNQANYNKLISSKVEVIDGIGSFVDENILAIEKPDGSVDKIYGEKIIINTGAIPFVPEIEGIKDNPFVYLSEELLDLEVLPEKLTIIGGGYISLEFASMYANFGCEVTIIQVEEVFLPREDEDISESIEGVLEKKGVKIIKSADIKKIEKADVYYRDKKSSSDRLEILSGDVILVATGRKPNISLLNAENARIEITERGAIKTDEFLRTSVKNIWAAGDVCGNLQFTYISLDDSRIILSDIDSKNDRTTKNRGAFSYSVFIDPPFSKVGLSEKEAREKNLDFRVVKMEAKAIPKARVIKKTDGILKALVDNKSGRILGAALFCSESHEIINMIKLAMDQELRYEVLRDFIFTHPTIIEGLNDLFLFKENLV